MADGPGVLIVAEAIGAALAPVTAELAGIGRTVADQLSSSLAAALLGSGAGSAADELGTFGVDTVLVADDPALSEYNGDAYVAVIERIVRETSPGVLLIAHTPNGRELAARLAFRLQTGLITDCTGLQVEDGLLVMTKPVYGGSAIGEFVVADARPQMATTRPRAFEPPTPAQGRQARVQSVPVSLGGAVRTRVVGTAREVAAAGPRLKDAKTIVTGGRGLGGPDNWHYVEELAGATGAAIGATRAVTDAGWVPAAMQVGLTGATVSPDLYIAVGVSGAVQHIAGCSGSRNIVAINKDPDANIFKHARYGVVGDYKQVVPALAKRIKELRG